MSKENTVMVKQTVTDSEIELVRMLSNGLTVREISEKRKTNLRTMEAVIDRMRGEYNCINIAHLVATFFRNKLIE
jgi:DNA-binding CsgD family transcriptional regulator